MLAGYPSTFNTSFLTAIFIDNCNAVLHRIIRLALGNDVFTWALEKHGWKDLTLYNIVVFFHILNIMKESKYVEAD